MCLVKPIGTTGDSSVQGEWHTCLHRSAKCTSLSLRARLELCCGQVVLTGHTADKSSSVRLSSICIAAFQGYGPYPWYSYHRLKETDSEFL